MTPRPPAKPPNDNLLPRALRPKGTAALEPAAHSEAWDKGGGNAAQPEAWGKGGGRAAHPEAWGKKGDGNAAQSEAWDKKGGDNAAWHEAWGKKGDGNAAQSEAWDKKGDDNAAWHEAWGKKQRGGKHSRAAKIVDECLSGRWTDHEDAFVLANDALPPFRLLPKDERDEVADTIIATMKLEDDPLIMDEPFLQYCRWSKQVGASYGARGQDVRGNRPSHAHTPDNLKSDAFKLMEELAADGGSAPTDAVAAATNGGDSGVA